MMVMVGAAAIAIVVVLVIMMRGGGEEDGKKGAADDTKPAASEKSATPVAISVGTGKAKAGGTPKRPAPALSTETLGKLDQLLAEAKTHYNDGVTKRTDGDNAGAREAQAKAKEVLEQWENLVKPQLQWQEEAEMEEWAQPAEYDLLTSKYAPFSSLQNMVRKGGGK
jgi:hypothetical protein